MKTERKCDVCKKKYLADNRNLKRGWGLCCSKKCAAKKRNKAIFYEEKEERYEDMTWADDDQWGDMDIGIS